MVAIASPFDILVLMGGASKKNFDALSNVIKDLKLPSQTWHTRTHHFVYNAERFCVQRQRGTGTSAPTEHFIMLSKSDFYTLKQRMRSDGSSSASTVSLPPIVSLPQCTPELKKTFGAML